GYLNRPELSRDKFIHNPFSAKEGDRLYKTGDLVRWSTEGNLEFIGRKDDQVKLRGFRIELGEVESSLLSLPCVQDAVVVARDEPARLVAYVVANPQAYTNESVLIETCRSELTSALPDYMVPSLFMLLDEIPLTPNGKVDRKGLPAPDATQSLQKYVVPSTETEQILCELWQTLLEVERVGITDNFFELGGHSLLAMQVISGLQQAGLEIEIRDLLTAPNLGELARVADQKAGFSRYIVPANIIVNGCTQLTLEMLPLLSMVAERTISQSGLDSLVLKVPGGVSNIQDIYPLSPTQEGIFYHHVVPEGADPYVLSALFELANIEQLESFLATLQFVFDRHDTLRTSVYWQGLEFPVQVVVRNAEVPIEWLSLDSDRPVRAQMESLCEPGNHQLDIEQGPLLRVEVAKDHQSDKVYMIVVLHHIISDHVGFEIIQREAWAHQNGFADTLSKPRAYREFVGQSLQQTNHRDAAAYFSEMLSDVDDATLPFGLSDVQGDGSRIDEMVTSLPNQVSKRIRLASKALKISPAVLFHAAWSLVVSACSGRSDIVFGTVLSGRLQGTQGAQDTLGMFINTLPLRVKLVDTDVVTLLRRIHINLTELLSFEQTSLALAQSCSSVSAGAPLFSSILNYRHSAPAVDAVVEGDHNSSTIQLLNAYERTNYPMAMSVDDFGDGFNLVAQLDRSVNPQRLLDYMHQAIESILLELEQGANRNVTELSVLPAAEVDRLLNQLNDTATVPLTAKFIHELFEQQVRLNPNSVALIFEQQQLTYANLNQRSNRLAHYLLSQGVKPDSLVGLCVERSLDMVIAILGILKAGGSYVPLDPSHPTARLSYMLSDSGVSLLLTQQRFVSVLPKGDHQLVLLDHNDQQKLVAEHSDANPDKVRQGLRADNLAYVIYTSGSTGQPKGVLCTHEALINRIDWMAREYAVGAEDKVLQKTPYTFDVSVWEFVLPLTQGSCLVMAKPEGHKDPIYLKQVIQKHAITILHFVPSMLSVMLSAVDLSACNSLSRVFCSGEALPKPLEEQFFANMASGTQLHNLYGPTEAAIDVSYWACEQGS
ncbi:MAG: AMP-binding protein, partial [Arenicella sp.]|nr:AMP-binding protein [Arenicella sp.]